MKRLCTTITVLALAACTSQETISPDRSTAASDRGRPAAALDFGLIAYYPFDGNANDYSGNGFNAVIEGAVPASGRDGAANSAYSLDGEGSRIVVPTEATQSLESGTISLWLVTNNPTTPSKCRREDLAGPDPFYCQYNIFAKPLAAGGLLRGQFASTVGPGEFVDSYSFEVGDALGQFVPPANYGFGSWHLFTFVWTPLVKRVYLDETLLREDSGSFPMPDGGPLYLGSNSVNDREPLDGVIDEVRIYNRALTSTEISSLVHGIAAQTIEFGPLGDKAFGDSAFDLTVSATSGLPVVLTATGNCLLDGVTVTITGAGTCTVLAAQAGNDDFHPAPEVSRTFSIAKADQTIEFSSLSGRVYGEPPVALSATATSGLSITYSALGSCSVVGNSISIVGAGSCQIVAQQAGNDDFNPAEEVIRGFEIARALPVITWSPQSPIAYGEVIGPAQLNATVTGVSDDHLEGSLTYSPGAGTALSPGLHNLSVTFVPDDQVNYREIGATAQVGVIDHAAVLGAGVWLGLKNSDDVGTKFDLRVEVLKNGVVVGSGQANGLSGGSSGFNNAVLRQVDGVTSTSYFATGDVLAVRISVRIAEGVSGHRSGTARLWYSDAGANSGAQVSVAGQPELFYLTYASILSDFLGSGPRRSVDVFVDRAVGGNPFKPFGTWARVF